MKTQKGNRKELPLSTKVLIRSFGFYSYVMAIIDNDMRTGNLVADIDIVGCDGPKWEIIVEDLKIRQEKENLKFYATNEFNINMNACIYRSADENDEIRIRIHSQQSAQAWSAINLFLSCSEKEDLLDESTYICRFGNFIKGGLYYMVLDQFIDIEKPSLAEPTTLVLKKEGNKVSIYSMDEENERCLLYSHVLDEVDGDDLKIGVELKLGDNAFYHWLFTNFIQVESMINGVGNRFRYFYGLERDWYYNNVNQFLKYNERDWNDISADYEERLLFVKSCINEGKYVEFYANQKFVIDQCDTDFFHHNLIYGYDDGKKHILMLGYNFKGHVKLFHMKYDDFIKPINFLSDYSKICLIEYDLNMSIFDIDIPYVMEMIRQYLDGFNSSWYLQSIVQNNEKVYGMKVYEEWLKRDEWLSYFINDRRILYVLYEHKICMKERIKFFYFKEFINEVDYINLKNQMNKIIDLARNFQLVVLKHTVKGTRPNKEQVHKMITELMKRERDCYEELLELLNGGTQNRKSFNFQNS